MRYIVCDFKISPSPDCMGMDHSCRNSFAAEVCKGFDELCVLEEHETFDRATIAKPLGRRNIRIRTTWQPIRLSLINLRRVE